MNTTDSKPRVPGPPDSSRAFTLTELLVILGIVAVLASLQLPAMAKATGRTKRAQCASNLRQIALALQIYGGEYTDKLPSNSGGNWLWDTVPSVGDLLSRCGAPWKVMYCPGTGPRFTDADNFRLYNYSSSFRVVGYALTLLGTPTLLATNVNQTLTPQAIQYLSAFLPPPHPEKRVLAADATISAAGQNNPAQKATYNWTSIAGGYLKPHLSPHLSGNMPAGGNVVMLDGHVDWRKLEVMLPRTAVSSSPIFWW
jgi:prepilin-type processing-associated H-X9-DG protein